MPPVQVKFDPNLADDAAPKSPARKKLDDLPAAPVATYLPPIEWTARGFSGARALQDRQKEKPGRIALPDSDFVREQMKKHRNRPPRGGVTADRPIRVLWTLCCYGYSPELAASWQDLQREFGAEAQLDRVFASSIFWVATNSVDCFY